jgi:hypothetical protein
MPSLCMQRHFALEHALPMVTDDGTFCSIEPNVSLQVPQYMGHTATVSAVTLGWAINSP